MSAGAQVTADQVATLSRSGCVLDRFKAAGPSPASLRRRGAYPELADVAPEYDGVVAEHNDVPRLGPEAKMAAVMKALREREASSQSRVGVYPGPKPHRQTTVTATTAAASVSVTSRPARRDNPGRPTPKLVAPLVSPTSERFGLEFIDAAALRMRPRKYS